MARRIEYLDDAPLTLQDVAEQCREFNVAALQTDLVTKVIIPGVVAQAEARSGAAIRRALYEEHWPAGYTSGHALDVGQAHTIVKIETVDDHGVALQTSAGFWLLQDQRESLLHFSGERPSGRLRITYEAGIDLDAYPSVRNWLLLHIGTVYGQRESLVVGQTVTELPASYLDSLLSDICVPPRF